MSILNSDDLKPFADLARSLPPGSWRKVAEHDRYPFGRFMRRFWQKLHDVGFLNAVLPIELGGTDFGIEALCAILENISEVDASPPESFIHRHSPRKF